MGDLNCWLFRKKGLPLPNHLQKVAALFMHICYDKYDIMDIKDSAGGGFLKGHFPIYHRLKMAILKWSSLKRPLYIKNGRNTHFFAGFSR